MTKEEFPHSKNHRRLREDEIALWLQVAARVQQRPGAILPILLQAASKPKKFPLPRQPDFPRVPTAAPYFPPTSPAKPKQYTLAPMEQRLKKKLLRGQTGIDASIDLHGMVQTQAHVCLRQFIHAAHGRGDRLVLVVTGKGQPKSSITSRYADDFGGTGVLRRVVPHWLHAPDLLPLIVSFELAGQAHGGAGALIVRLRRKSKSG